MKKQENNIISLYKFTDNDDYIYPPRADKILCASGCMLKVFGQDVYGTDNTLSAYRYPEFGLLIYPYIIISRCLKFGFVKEKSFMMKVNGLNVKN